MNSLNDMFDDRTFDDVVEIRKDVYLKIESVTPQQCKPGRDLYTSGIKKSIDDPFRYKREGSFAEYAASKITFNVIAPSLTDTPLASMLLSTDEKKEASNKRHPLQRIGNPDEISKLVSFLLSEDASWMTGQIIGIDGGMGSLKV